MKPETTDNQTAPAEFLISDESKFEFVIVAALRCKQLSNGASPRIIADTLKRKNTSIAREEVKHGLVAFTTAEAVKQ